MYQAGVSKLNEAKELVDTLKRKAGEQSRVLAEKQEEADQSLQQITITMQVKRGGDGESYIWRTRIHFAP